MFRLITSNFSHSVITIFVCLWLFNPLFVQAQDYQQASKAIENLASEIRMNEGAVGQVLMEAMQSKHGDMQKWNELNAKMTALGQSIDRNLPEIGQNIALLFAQNPDFYLPSVALGRTFEGNLRMATDKKKQLLELARSENQKLDKLNQMLAKVDKGLGSAARELIGATMESFYPDEISLAGEGAIVVLGAYFGPPGIAAAGLVWFASGSFNAVVNTYYNAKGAADQTRALTEMKQGLQARKREVEKNLGTLMEAAREMEQIEQILDRHDKTMAEYKARVNAAMDGWNEQSKGAFEAKKKKLDEEAQRLAAQPRPELKPWGWAYGMDPIPPISAGEYSGEVDSMISQMRSYAQAVEDGGAPDNFQIMVTDWHNRINERYNNTKKDYEQKRKAYENAGETFWKSYYAAGAEARRAYAALWASCRPWDDRCRAAAAAIGNRYDAAIKAAYAAWRPFGQAMISPYREMVKLNQISSRVGEAYSPFRERVDNATKARTREFWNEYRLWETKMNEANVQTSEAVAGVPYWIDQWKNRADKLDEEIQNSLYWGGNIVDIRTGLLATAEQLRELHKTVQDTAKKYGEVNGKRMQISNQAQSELTSILNRYGRLINYYWSSNFSMSWLGSPMEFTPHAPEQERNIAYYEELIKKTFTIYEPDNLKNALKLDIPGIAARYENKARELTFYTDWVDTYRYRLSTAAGALNRISIEKTGNGFYAARGGTAQEVLSKEFSLPPWSTIVQDADKYISKGDYSALPQARFLPWDSLGVWNKLYAGQTILLNRLHKDGRNYIQSVSSGWFMPLPETVIKPLEEDWKNLRQVCERYDVLAKAEREKIGDGQEQAQKSGQLVFETWGKLPAHSRSIVQNEHVRFQSAYNWLYSYLGSKIEAVRPSLQPPTNSVAVDLDNWILGYASRFEKYKKDQEEAHRRMEEAQRRHEEEQKLLQEEERKKAEAERQRVENEQKRAAENVVLVKDLYARFKQAYEGKNDSLLLSMISDEWQAGDGASLSDLQVNLRRSFKTFDEIRYNIQNLTVTPAQDGSYRVTYDVTITSRIYKRNLKHEEKSSIHEEVLIDRSGKPKISKTLGGRFWYVQ
ncbi:MAG: hypothetical protein C0394_01710 [Syntrophus sp. (in: bacteria)]|nr:hypothetical protein [Syntrophus sp. (in: bacteria)]